MSAAPAPGYRLTSADVGVGTAVYPSALSCARVHERRTAARLAGVIDSATFERAVRTWAKRGTDLPRARLVVANAHDAVVDLRSLHARAPLDLTGYHFETAVDLRGARIDAELRIDDCGFEKGLMLAGAHIDGDLTIATSDFGAPVRGEAQKGNLSFPAPLDLNHAQIGADLTIRGCMIDGSLDANLARVGGDLFAYYLDADVLRAPDMRITGGMWLTDSTFRRVFMDGTRTHGKATVSRCRVISSVDLRRVRADELTVSELSAGNDLAIDGAIVERTVFLMAVRVGGAIVGNAVRAARLQFTDLLVTTDLQLDAMRVTGDFTLAYSTVSGAVHASNASCGGIDVGSVRIAGALALLRTKVIRAVHVRAARIGECMCRGLEADELYFYDAQVAGSLSLLRTRIARALALCPQDGMRTTVGLDVDARGLYVGGDFRVIGVRIGGALNLDDADLREAWIHDGLVPVGEGARGCRPQACVMARFSARKAEIRSTFTLVAFVRGAIDLAGARLRSNATFSFPDHEPSEALQWTRRNHEFVGFAPDAVVTDDGVRRGVRAQSLSLDDAECDGDADLSMAELTRWHVPAVLSARGARVTGELRLCRECDQVRCREDAHLRVGEGAIDLEGARLGRLRISGFSFRHAPPRRSEPESRGGTGTWARLRVAALTVGVLSAGAVAAACAALLPALADLHVGGERAWHAWRAVVLAAILLLASWACLREIWRAMSATRAGDPAAPGGRIAVSPQAAAEHHILALHGIGRRALMLSLAQLWVRTLFATVAAGAIVGRLLDESLSPLEATWLPVLAFVLLVFRRYVRALLAVSHASCCVTAWHPRSQPASERGPGVPVAAKLATLEPFSPIRWSIHAAAFVKNAVAIVAALDVLLVGAVLLAIRNDYGIDRQLLLAIVGAALVGMVTMKIAGFVQYRLVDRLRRRFPGEKIVSESESIQTAVAAVRGVTVDDRRLRRAVLRLSLSVLAFRDVLQVATLNSVAITPYRRRRPSLNLASATVEELEVVKPIPRDIAIANLTVSRWQIDGEDAALSALEVLDHASEFKADVYHRVAESLRNGGQRDKAETLHRAAQRQARWRDTRWLRTLLSLGHSLSGYGTHRAPVLALVLAWFLFTATWFAAEYRDALAPSIDYAAEYLQVSDCGDEWRADLAVRCEELQQIAALPLVEPNARQRIGQGLAVALRYHLPIIAWDLWPYAQPRTETVWAYTSIVTAVHWVVWPLLLASLLPALMPRSEK